MTYSCAIWSRGATTLEEAQRTKLELVCTKLALQPGERVLDVGCGWGAFAHPRRARARRARHRDHAVASRRRSWRASARRPRASADKVDIRVMDYREIAGETFDAIASIGMVEHVGCGQHRPLHGEARVAAEARRAAAQPRHRAAARRRRRGGAVLGALRVPGRGAAAPLADPARARARRPAHPPRRGLPGRLRAHAAGVAAALRVQHRPGAASSAATSACACGGSTCACRARASRAASCPSTRSGRSSRSIGLAERTAYGRHPAACEVRALLSPAIRAVRVQLTASRIVRGRSQRRQGVIYVHEVLRRSRRVAARRARARRRAASPPPSPSRRSSSRTCSTAATSSPSPPRARARRSPSPRRSSTCSTPTARKPAALVLAPTRELVSQIVEEARPLAAPARLNVAAVYGGVGFEKQITQRPRRAHRRRHARPPRGPARSAARSRSRDVEILVLDEADRMLDMGFRPAVDRIVAPVPERSPDAVLLAPRSTARSAASRPTTRTTRVAHEHTPAPEHDGRDRAPLPRRRPRQPHRRARRGAARDDRDLALVFVRTKRGADRLVKRLGTEGVARRRDARQQVPEPARARAGRVRARARSTRSSPPTSPPAASTSPASRT